MSRRPRSSRSGRRSTTRPAYGGGFYGADLASVQMLTPGDFPAMLARFTPRPSVCTTCSGPIRRLGLLEFAAAWARVTDQGADASVLDDLQSDSLWWCDRCDRGGAAFLADGEEVAMGVGASCSCCA